MDEVINEIVDDIRKRIDDFSYMDQQLAYDQLAEWCRMQSETALRMEYMADE